MKFAWRHSMLFFVRWIIVLLLSGMLYCKQTFVHFTGLKITCKVKKTEKNVTYNHLKLKKYIFYS